MYREGEEGKGKDTIVVVMVIVVVVVMMDVCFRRGEVVSSRLVGIRSDLPGQDLVLTPHARERAHTTRAKSEMSEEVRLCRGQTAAFVLFHHLSLLFFFVLFVLFVFVFFPALDRSLLTANVPICTLLLSLPGTGVSATAANQNPANSHS